MRPAAFGGLAMALLALCAPALGAARPAAAPQRPPRAQPRRLAEETRPARLVDDYLSGCAVFCDLDGDEAQGEDEPSCTTNLLGKCEYEVASEDVECALVFLAAGQADTCVDVGSLLAPVVDMKSYGDVVSPLSTVSAALVDWEFAEAADSGSGSGESALDVAEAMMADAFPALAATGCAPSTCNAVANLDRRASADEKAVFAALTQVHETMLLSRELIVSSGGSAADAMQATARALADEVYGAQSALALADTDTVGDVLARAADLADVVVVAAVVDALAATAADVNARLDAAAEELDGEAMLLEASVWNAVVEEEVAPQAALMAAGSQTPDDFLVATNATALTQWEAAWAEELTPAVPIEDDGGDGYFGFGPAVPFVVYSMIGLCVLLCVYDLTRKNTNKPRSTLRGKTAKGKEEAAAATSNPMAAGASGEGEGDAEESESEEESDDSGSDSGDESSRTLPPVTVSVKPVLAPDGKKPLAPDGSDGVEMV